MLSHSRRRGQKLSSSILSDQCFNTVHVTSVAALLMARSIRYITTFHLCDMGMAFAPRLLQ